MVDTFFYNKLYIILFTILLCKQFFVLSNAQCLYSYTILHVLLYIILVCLDKKRGDNKVCFHGILLGTYSRKSNVKVEVVVVVKSLASADW